MSRRNVISPLQVMNTELLALMEYARVNHIQVNVNKLVDTLRPLIEKEIDAKYEKNANDVDIKNDSKKSRTEQDEERQRKAALQSESDKRKAQVAKHNLDSDPVKEQVKMLLNGYLRGNPAAERQLLSLGGSLLSLYTIAKQDKSEDFVDTLGVTDDIKEKHAYFVPNITVQTYMQRNNITNFATAMNDVQRNDSILCNFKLDQQTRSGDWYIEGGKPGLLVLLGTAATIGKRPVAGILDVCGIEPKSRELMVMHKGRGSTRYAIVLDPENGKKFQEEITKPTSLLRSKYVTLTDVSRTSTKSTGEHQVLGDDGENPMENKDQGDLTKGQEALASDRSDDTNKLLSTIQRSITLLYQAIASYMSVSAREPNRYPQIKVEKPAPSSDQYQYILNAYSALSKCAVEFCDAFGVELPLVHGKSGGYSCDVAIYDTDTYYDVDHSVDRRYGYMKTIKDNVKKMNTAFHSGLYYVDKNITKMLSLMKFGDDIDQSVSGETESAVAAQRSKRAELMEQKYTTIDHKQVSLSSMLYKVPDSILGDFDSDDSIIKYNPELVNAYKKANEIEVNLSRNVMVSDDELEQNCATLAKLLLAHFNDTLRLNKLAEIRSSLSKQAQSKLSGIYADLRNKNDAFYPISDSEWRRAKYELICLGNDRELLKKLDFKRDDNASVEPNSTEPATVASEPKPVKKPAAPVEPPSAPENLKDRFSGRTMSMDDFDEESELADMTISRV